MSPRSASDRMMRGIRGVLLAGCSATLSVAAHALGGGPLPHLLPTLALTVLIGWVSTALAEQTRGLGGVLIVLGSAQLVSHLLLGELSGHTVNSPAMLTCHGVATFATAFVLARAEAMLAMAAAVLSLLRGLFVVCVASPGRMGQRSGHPVVRTAEGLSAVAVLLRRAHPRRGPPSTLLTSSERHPASV